MVQFSNGIDSICVTQHCYWSSAVVTSRPGIPPGECVAGHKVLERGVLVWCLFCLVVFSPRKWNLWIVLNSVGFIVFIYWQNLTLKLALHSGTGELTGSCCQLWFYNCGKLLCNDLRGSVWLNKTIPLTPNLNLWVLNVPVERNVIDLVPQEKVKIIHLSRFSLRVQSGRCIPMSCETGLTLYKGKFVTLGACGTSEVVGAGGSGMALLRARMCRRWTPKHHNTVQGISEATWWSCAQLRGSRTWIVKKIVQTWMYSWGAFILYEVVQGECCISVLHCK